MKFVLDGVEHKVRLTLNGKSLPPTPANHKHAVRLVASVRRAIELGVFSWAEFFPDAPQAQEKAQDAPETFGQLADMWHRSKGKLVAATRDQYGTAVRFWKARIGADRPLSEVTHKLLAAEVGSYPWRSPKQHNNYLIALRGIMALEYSGARSVSDPTTGITNMKVVKKSPDPLSKSERDRILADLAKHYDPRVTAYFQWQFYTGMRPEETIALRWSDVDEAGASVRVQRVRTFKGSEREGSKTHSERDVELVPEALEALSAMKPHTYMRRREDGEAADIFQNPVTGRAWHDERSQRDHYWRPALKRLGIRWRPPYNTRHTYCTVALMAGVPPGYIAQQAGHSLKMLLEVYAKWLPENDEGRARALMALAMSGAPADKGVMAGK